MHLRTLAWLVAPLLAVACAASPATRATNAQLPLTTAAPDQYPAGTAPAPVAPAPSGTAASAQRSDRAQRRGTPATPGAASPRATATTATVTGGQVAAPTVDTSCRRPASSVGSGVAAKGQTPPSFTATTIDCKALDFGSFTKGRPTLVTFYASWCSGCQAEARDLQAIYQEWHAKNGFVIVAIDTKDESGSPQIYYRHFGWTFVSVWDDKEKILDAWFSGVSANALPVSYWIKPDGTVNDIVIGSESRGQMEQEMSAL